MAVNDPIWSYGKSRLIKSSGNTVAADDDIWSYGRNELRHEYTEAAGALEINVAESLASSEALD